MSLTILPAPDPAPVAQTADGKPGRRIEWVGEKSVMDEPFVWTGIATGRFTKEQEALLRRCALKRSARTRDTERRLGPHDPGLSREVVWSRRNGWTQVLIFADAEKVLSCPDGHEFIDRDAAERDEPAVLYPPVELRLVSREVLKVGRDELVRVG
jgi:hypothetical protein